MDTKAESQAEAEERRKEIQERLKPKIALHCSFCSKPATQVKKLIAGPGVYICNECINLCVEILIEGNIPIECETEHVLKRTEEIKTVTTKFVPEEE